MIRLDNSESYKSHNRILIAAMNTIFIAIFLCISFIECTIPSSQHVTVEVNPNVLVANISHFWKSTGFCPPDPHSKIKEYVLSKDMKTNLRIISSIPHNGITQVRIHWLLNLIKRDSKKSLYDFKDLDEFLDFIISLGLKPGFELMGNPSNYFTNFNDPVQVYEWRNLIYKLSTHLIDRFGIEELKNWNFETWNEPDHHDFDDLNVTIKGFMNYYDASLIGLKTANPLLKLGGPGASCRPTLFSKICWAFFKHVTTGINYFTGKIGTELDFISFHKKGGGKSFQILQEELETITRIITKYPELQKLKIYNDEGDPMKGWSKPLNWRADATYAAIITKVVIQHQQVFKKIFNGSSINYALLSNDNAFLNYAPNYFSQRTLLARIQINNTNPRETHFIRKPVHSAMGLLSKLGNEQTHASIHGCADNLDVLTSIRFHNESDWEQAILISMSADTSNKTGIKDIRLKIKSFDGAGSSAPYYVIYMIDNEITNPYKIWLDNNQPIYPDSKLRQLLRNHQEPQLLQKPRIFHPKSLNILSLQIKLPGVALVHICESGAPQSVTNLRTTILTHCDILLTWSDAQLKSRCILTYEIQFSKSIETPMFKTINGQKFIFNAYQYSPRDCQMSGIYRVRAVDYKHRKGPFTNKVSM